MFACLWAVMVLGRFCRQLLALLNRLFDGANHIESGLRQMIVLARYQVMEATDGVRKLDVLSLPPREGLCDGEGLGQADTIPLPSP